MNTKSIIGIIIVLVIIVLIAAWLFKAPASPEPVTTTTPVTTEQPAATDTASTPVATTTPATAPAATPTKPAGTTTTIQGMKVTVTKEGAGTPIKNGQTAVMLYTGTLADGTVFDASSKHGNVPFEFSLGAGQVIKGWDLGVAGMKVGEERTLVIPPELGYGANGYPPVIPQNATLTFTVKLVGIK